MMHLRVAVMRHFTAFNQFICLKVFFIWKKLFVIFDIKYLKNIDCFPVFGQIISTSFENSMRDYEKM